MNLQHYPIDSLKENILTICGKYIDVKQYKIFFFGSRVTGGGTDRSDIDVGIDGSQSVPATAFLQIIQGIEQIPTLYKIEVVDFADVSDKFRQVALQKIEPLN